MCVNLSIRQDSLNNNPNQGYSLNWFDAETGIAQVQSPNAPTAYWVNLYESRCSCPGFRAHKRCKHIKTDGLIWRLCWASAGSVPSLSVYDDFMAGDRLTDSERESDFRQMLDFEADVDPWMGGRMVA